MKRVLRNPTIWLILGFGGAAGFVQGVMTGHQVAYLRDMGANPMIAATTLSVIAGCSVIGSLGFGALAIKLNIRQLLVICFIVRLIALAILLTTQNIILIYLYSILFGISNGAIGTAKFSIGGSYYGRESFSRIQGIIALGLVLQAAGPVVGGAIYDRAGSYSLAFIIITIVTVIGLICAFLARPPKLSVPAT
jgi:cyanate permease